MHGLVKNLVAVLASGMTTLKGILCIFWSYLGERPSLVGSLAGAAHLLHDNTGVLRGAQ